MISEQFNDVRPIKNKIRTDPLVVRTIYSSIIIVLLLYIIIRHYCFSSHLIGRNNDFLVLRDAYVNAVPSFIRTINILPVTNI